MAEYIFYTPEGYTEAPDGDEIDNCQMLGRATGADRNEALMNLLKDNPWIEERDYDVCEIIGAKLADGAEA